MAIGVLLSSVGLTGFAPTPARADSGSAYKIADESSRPVGKAHETFFTTDVALTYAQGQTVRLAGDPTGTAVFTPGDYSGNVYVDDAMDITVQHPDGTLINWSNEWTFECFGLYPSGPVDLSGLFQPGLNLVRISLRDECGGAEGSSPLYFIGDAKASAGPGDAPVAAAVYSASWRYTS